jgi:hypothetical protein
VPLASTSPGVAIAFGATSNLQHALPARNFQCERVDGGVNMVTKRQKSVAQSEQTTAYEERCVHLLEQIAADLKWLRQHVEKVDQKEKGPIRKAISTIADDFMK